MPAPSTPPGQTIRSSSRTPPPAPRGNRFRDAIAEEEQQQASVGGPPRSTTVGRAPFQARLRAIAAESNQTAVAPAVSAPAPATNTTADQDAAAITPANDDSVGPSSTSASLGEDPSTDSTDSAADAPALPDKKRPREEDDEDEKADEGAADGASKKMKA